MMSFDGQLQRSVGKADAGMANVGECLAIAEQITEGDRDSWHRAWSEFATGLVARGDQARSAGHPSAPATCICARLSTSARRSSFTERISTPTSSSARSQTASARFALPWSCLTIPPVL